MTDVSAMYVRLGLLIIRLIVYWLLIDGLLSMELQLPQYKVCIIFIHRSVAGRH